MKKLISYLLSVTLILSMCTGMIQINNTTIYAATSDNWPSAPKLIGKSAVLIEASTGTVLYEKKAHKKMYPASITKIMTALLTIENCKLDETVTFSEKAINSLSYDDANFGCQVGEKMTVKDCLYILMLSSANEVAYALGEHVAGSIEKFADMMNERAKEAGATDTHFVNASGLHDPNHYITAYDMAMITRAASKYEVFNNIVNTTSYTIKKNNKRKESANSIQRHKMVWPNGGYYYDGIIGGKTGFTDQAGTTLVTYAKRNGMTLIAVVLKSNGLNVYSDTKALLDYGFNNFSLVNASQKDSRFDTENTSSLQSPFCTSTDRIYIDTESNIVLPKDTKFSNLSSHVSFELSDDSFGTITYSLGSRTLGTAKLKYESNKVEATTAAETTTVPSENASAQETTVSGKGNSKEETTIKETTAAFDEETTLADSGEKKKAHKKLTIPKFLPPVIIGLVVILLILSLIIVQRRRLNKVRSMKRHRTR